MTKIFLAFVAILCIASYSSAAVATKCDYKEQIHLLALNMYHEARGKGDLAMQMVGEVVLNRAKSNKFPNSICAVIKQPGQFSWVRKKNTTPKEKDQWLISLKISEDLISGKADYINNGALYFNNSPMNRKHKIGNFGGNIFYK